MTFCLFNGLFGLPPFIIIGLSAHTETYELVFPEYPHKFNQQSQSGDAIMQKVNRMMFIHDWNNCSRCLNSTSMCRNEKISIFFTRLNSIYSILLSFRSLLPDTTSSLCSGTEKDKNYTYFCKPENKCSHHFEDDKKNQPWEWGLWIFLPDKRWTEMSTQSRTMIIKWNRYRW